MGTDLLVDVFSLRFRNGRMSVRRVEHHKVPNYIPNRTHHRCAVEYVLPSEVLADCAEQRISNRDAESYAWNIKKSVLSSKIIVFHPTLHLRRSGEISKLDS